MELFESVTEKIRVLRAGFPTVGKKVAKFKIGGATYRQLNGEAKNAHFENTFEIVSGDVIAVDGCPIEFVPEDHFSCVFEE